MGVSVSLPTFLTTRARRRYLESASTLCIPNKIMLAFIALREVHDLKNNKIITVLMMFMTTTMNLSPCVLVKSLHKMTPENHAKMTEVHDDSLEYEDDFVISFRTRGQDSTSQGRKRSQTKHISSKRVVTSTEE